MKMMNNMMAVCDEHLEAAVGGAVTVNGCRFSGYIAPHCGEVGQYYYIVNCYGWWYGKLTKNYEETRVSFIVPIVTTRKHEFDVEIYNGAAFECSLAFDADYAALYTVME